MEPFDGYPERGLEFLTDLGTGRDKEWFAAHRAVYDEHVVAPAKAFVVAMGDHLAAGMAPAAAAVPRTNGSIAPINNDVRFTPDAPPYKDHLLFRFWEGPDRKTAPTLWVRVHPIDGVGFASGITFTDVERWRDAVADPSGEALATAVDELVATTGVDVVGQVLKRVPRPHPPDHPRGALLRHKGFQVRWVVPVPSSIGSAEFVPWCGAELERLADVHRWLVEHLG